MPRSALAAFACAIVALLSTPAFSAHLDPGAHPPPFASTGMDRGAAFPLDPHAETVDPVQGNGLDRVAGWYVGWASPWVDLRSESLATWSGVPPPLDGWNGKAFAPRAHERFPAGACDLEVAGLGGGDPIDESVVDGSTAGGGQAPDGLWNDGGVSMACHRADAWDEPDYNTPGCDQYGDPASPSFGGARAEDVVSGAGIWVMTACDSTMPAWHFDFPFPGSLLEMAEGSADCAVRDGPDAACLAEDCWYRSEVHGEPYQSCPQFAGWGGVFCFADGYPDGVSFGRGGGHAGPGVPFPPSGAGSSNGASCDGRAEASVLVLDAVVATFDAGTATLTVHESSAPTHGWIA